MTGTPSFAPGGTVSGAGGYATGSSGTLVATPAVGYQFRNWTEGGVVVSSGATYSFTATANRSLVANFIPIVGFTTNAPGPFTITWPASAVGWVLRESSDLTAGSWVDSNLPVSTSVSQNHVLVTPSSSRRFFRLDHP